MNTAEPEKTASRGAAKRERRTPPPPIPLPPPAEERFSGFESLMPFRIQRILLVASPYDSFTLEGGGRLTELLLNEYRELNLSFSPRVTRTSTGEEALALIESTGFDLVITMTRLGDMDPALLAHEIHAKRPHLPVILLTFNPGERAWLLERAGRESIDRIFQWTGDVRILLAIIKHVEDERNVEHDTRYGEVRTILLVEDSVRFYSSYLPLLYTEVLRQTHDLMEESVNLSHRLLRLRARPKVLLATSHEEAWEIFLKYKDYLLGVISDARFPRQGKSEPTAGLEFIRRLKEVDPHLPVVMQSSDADMAGKAAAIGAGFIRKNSPSLHQDLRAFMLENFGFGDFVFRLPDGTEVARAGDTGALVRVLAVVPPESLAYHASHDHFSNWFRARTEFGLASQLRPVKVSEFQDLEELRSYLIQVLSRFLDDTQRGIVTDFSRRRFDAWAGFVRIGGGALGGKARGLAFMNSVLSPEDMKRRFPGVELRVPPTAVVGTDIFDAFLERKGLRELALSDTDDETIVEAFRTKRLPRGVFLDLGKFIEQVTYPLAVRSSSLLEDSQYQPFAGVYSTYMLPNDHPEVRTRLDRVAEAVKLVYASTFLGNAKAYLEATGNRVEEEKMAVVIQELVGARHEKYVYPDFAGVAYSTNFYPTGGLRPEDGVAMVALGLGRTVVEGRKCLRFSPRQPGNLPQFGTVKDMLRNSQRQFFALDMEREPVARENGIAGAMEGSNLSLLDLSDAERHGTLEAVGSVHSPENDAVYDGIWREGPRLVTFAHVLKQDLFPLAEILDFLLDLGKRSMCCEVEIEFAVTLARDGAPHRFAFLQIRPLASGHETVDLSPAMKEPEGILCSTSVALGNGRPQEIRDIVYVPASRMDRGATPAIAEEIGSLNHELAHERRPYLLIGPGRWGSADRWLGIPVQWAQISGARVIVETDLEDYKVAPSQGTHFFQNLTSMQIGYLTVHRNTGGSLDSAWLDAQPAARETRYLRHLRFDRPLTILIDGRQGRAVVRKP